MLVRGQRPADDKPEEEGSGRPPVRASRPAVPGVGCPPGVPESPPPGVPDVVTAEYPPAVPDLMNAEYPGVPDVVGA